jgi:site-specific DNA recombinase
LQRKMDELGITDPWVSVTEPPSDYNRLRRHNHERYRFEPLDGFPLKWPK